MRAQEWNLIKTKYQEELLQLERRVQAASMVSPAEGPRASLDHKVEGGTFGRNVQARLNPDLVQL